MVRKTRTAFAAIAMIMLAGLPAAADEAADIAAVKAATTTLDDAFEHRDAARILAMVTPDHRAVTFYYGGPQTTAEQIATLPGLKFEIYDVGDEEIALIGSDAALVTFENSYRGTFAGKPVPHRVFVSEIWVRIDGKWLQKLYQETVVQAE